MKARAGLEIPEASVSSVESYLNGLGCSSPAWEWTELAVVLTGCVCVGRGTGWLLGKCPQVQAVTTDCSCFKMLLK